MLDTIAVANYRSLRNIVMPLGKLTLISGKNGSGKSNIYRALRLLSDSAQGGIISSVAREGGLSSTLWAGPEKLSRRMKSGAQPVQGTGRSEPVSLCLGFAGGRGGYIIDLGLPPPPRPESDIPPTAFSRDPEIKCECIFTGAWMWPAGLVAERRNSAVRLRGDAKWEMLPRNLAPFETMLTEVADPQRAPEVLLLRDQIRSWRFYDHFRTDMDAPIRQPQIGTRTPVLNHDGSDLAAAMQTIIEIGEHDALMSAVSDAFPGSELFVECIDGRFLVQLKQHGLLRPLSAAELSDGTLRYLCWIAALLTPRPPQLMVLNEPETSLYPDLLPALARLIETAASKAQILVVSHAKPLIDALQKHRECKSVVLEKELGETRITGLHDLEEPPWHWPERGTFGR